MLTAERCDACPAVCRTRHSGQERSMKMQKLTRYAAAGGAALVIASGGAATGMAIQAPSAPKIPTSCVAPMNNGAYKTVPDGDAERYDSGVYVCARGLWVLDEEYGQ